jgi:hypothetical protein
MNQTLWLLIWGINKYTKIIEIQMKGYMDFGLLLVTKIIYVIKVLIIFLNFILVLMESETKSNNGH